MEWKFIKDTDCVINIKGEIITRKGEGVKVKSRLNSKNEKVVKLTLHDKTRKNFKVKDLLEEYFGTEFKISNIKINKEEYDKLKNEDVIQWEMKCFLKEMLKFHASKLGKEYDDMIKEYEEEKILVNCLGFCIENVKPIVFNNYKEVSELLDIDEIVVLGTALGLNKFVKYYYKGLSMCITKGRVFLDNFPNLNIDDYIYNEDNYQKDIIEVMRKTNVAYTVWNSTKDKEKVEDLTTYRDFSLLNSKELRKKYSVYYK